MTQKSKKSTQKYQSKKVPETLILQGILALIFSQTVKNRFEDLILTAYVIIDDLYRRFAPPEVQEFDSSTKEKSLKALI